MVLLQLASIAVLAASVISGSSLNGLVFALAAILAIASITIVRPQHVFSPRFWSLIGVMFYLVLAPLGIPVSYSSYHESVYYEAYLYVVIAVFAYLLPLLIFADKAKREQSSFEAESEILQCGIRTAGIIFVGLGYAFFLYSFSRIGGVFEALTTNRIAKASALSESYGSIPYSIFLSVGLAGYLYSILGQIPELKNWRSLKTNRQLQFFFVLISPIAIFWLIEGERSALIKLLIILGGVLSLRFKISFNRKVIASFMLAFFLLTFVGYFRGPLALSLNEGNLNAIKNRINQASLHWLFPREFSAIYFSHTTSVYLNDPPQYGKSYITALPNLLPRSIYPGKKPQTLSHEFGERVANLVGRGKAFGVGFSPLAEGYINFRGIGVFLTFFVYGLLVVFTPRLSLRNNFFTSLFYCLSLPMFWLFFRSAFSGTVRYLAFCYVLLFLFSLLAHFIASYRSGFELQKTKDLLV